jgi:hypothetical protein
VHSRVVNRKRAEFLTRQDWPVSSPDLNPLDYCTLAYILGKIDNTKHTTLSQFKTRLIKIWEGLPQKLVRIACMSFNKRCQVGVKGRGERFVLNKYYKKKLLINIKWFSDDFRKRTVNTARDGSLCDYPS